MIVEGESFPSFEFSVTFFESLIEPDFTNSDRRRLVRALRLLHANERHPPLRVHQLQGEWARVWSASASDVLRITFRRLPEGRKKLLTCSRHYQQ